MKRNPEAASTTPPQHDRICLPTRMHEQFSLCASTAKETTESDDGRSANYDYRQSRYGFDGRRKRA